MRVRQEIVGMQEEKALTLYIRESSFRYPNYPIFSLGTGKNSFYKNIFARELEKKKGQCKEQKCKSVNNMNL